MERQARKITRCWLIVFAFYEIRSRLRHFGIFSARITFFEVPYTRQTCFTNWSRWFFAPQAFVGKRTESSCLRTYAGADVIGDDLIWWKSLEKTRFPGKFAKKIGGLQQQHLLGIELRTNQNLIKSDHVCIQETKVISEPFAVRRTLGFLCRAIAI